MKISKNVWIAVIVLVALAGLTIGNIVLNDAEEVDTTATSEVEAGEFVVSEDGTVVSYAGIVGETALQTLQGLPLDVRVETSEFGVFVTGIGDVDADSSSNFWAFYVNGSQAEVGAGSYESKEGDQIEWRIEEFNF